MTTKPNKDPDNAEQLAYLTAYELRERGWPRDMIVGFLVASFSQGALRDGAPKWLRKQAAFLLVHGKGIEPSSIDDCCEIADEARDAIQSATEHRTARPKSGGSF